MFSENAEALRSLKGGWEAHWKLGLSGTFFVIWKNRLLFAEPA